MKDISFRWHSQSESNAISSSRKATARNPTVKQSPRACTGRSANDPKYRSRSDLPNPHRRSLQHGLNVKDEVLRFFRTPRNIVEPITIKDVVVDHRGIELIDYVG